MGVSEVAYGDRTIMSITDSTVTPDTLADGAVAYGADGERIVGRMTMGLPVGHEWITMNPNIPIGCLPLFGGTYSRSAYADLWAWVQTQTGYLIGDDEWQMLSSQNGGNVPFYSDGDGSTTFRVPSLKCWVKGASGIEEVGSYLKAGLPNIEGHVANLGLNSGETTSDYSGAFVPSASTIDYGGSSRGSKKTNLTFDASLSNPIYGNSDTVQPPSIVGMWLVKAFGTVSNIGNQDIADVSAGLAIAESRIGQLENGVPSDYIVESYRNGTDWYEVYKSGKIRQGGIWKGSLSVPTDLAVAINVTFLKPFANTNYYASVMHRTQNTVFGGGMAAASEDASGKTTTSCKFYYTSFYAVRTITEACWVAEGQGSDEIIAEGYMLTVDAASGKYASAYTITTTVGDGSYTGSIAKNVERGARVTVTAVGGESDDWRYDGSTVVFDGIDTGKTSYTFTMGAAHTVTFTDGHFTYIGSGT